MYMKNALFNWSGGKDSAFALYEVLKDKDISVKYLITTLNGANNRVSMHGVRSEILELQAEMTGIELKKIMLPEKAPLDIYDKIMKENLLSFSERGIEYSVFGDIFLEDLRVYREERLKEANMKGLFPLWKRPTDKLAREFISLGFKSVVTCVNARCLDASFLGRVIDTDFINSLPAGVDPCGENGEFHSFVFDGPVFSGPIPYKTGEIVEKEYVQDGDGKNFDNLFRYIDIIPG